MADWVANIALGKIAYYATLPAASDALILVLLQSTGLEADATLRDYDDLASLLAASNDECTATNYARKSITSVTVTVDDTNNRVDLDFADQTFVALGGASNNTLAKALVCYDGDTAAGTDSAIIPLAAFDVSAVTDGNDLLIQLNASGFARAAAA